MGAAGALVLILAAIIVFCIVRSRRSRSKTDKLSKELQQQHQQVSLSLDQLRELHVKTSNGTLNYNNHHMTSAAPQDDYLDAERQCLMASFMTGGGKPANGINGNMYHDEGFDTPGIQTRKLPEVPAIMNITDSGMGENFW